ncbi:MAG TPA: HK97 gp10 family phage protein [Caulobacterales bacterium]|nr:HK97 gp10 family phage protein [Caulobacterales bacterium]
MAAKFSNKARLKRKLKALPLAMVEATRAGMAAAADKVVKSQKALAPIKSGDLRDSITWTWGDAQKTAYSQGGISFGVMAGSKNFSGDLSLKVRISAGNTKVRYAHLVEFGTSPHTAGGKFKGAAHPGTAAQAFFFPGYRLEKKNAKARIRRASKKGAQSIAKQQ